MTFLIPDGSNTLFLQSTLLRSPRWRHAFGTRWNGPPAGPGSPRQALLDAVCPDHRHAPRTRQVHGTQVWRATPVGHQLVLGDARGPAPTEPAEGDAVCTNQPGVAVSILTADCLPVLLIDPHTPAVAAVHAGWRGLLGGIVAATVSAMADAFGSRPQHLLAGGGPAIGACCYEVSPELGDRFVDRFGAAVRYAHRSGPPHLDLPACLRHTLDEAGLPPAHQDISRLCTRCHPEVFHSYRRDGEQAGRMASLIMLAG